MSPTGPHDDDSLSLEQERQIDAACQRFEQAWKAAAGPDGWPRIEDHLPGPAEAVYPALLLELVRLDLYYRRRAGEGPRPADYQARFPTLDRERIARALAPGPDLPSRDTDEWVG
jgi:hypothetical protein